MSTELQTIEQINQQIDMLRQAADQIRVCRDVVIVKRFADFAELMTVAVRRVRASVEIANEAAEAAVRARHWEGTLLAEMPKEEGGRPQKNRSHDGTGFQSHPKPNGEANGTMPPTLKEIGITKNESSRAQAIAAIPEAVLDQAIQKAKESGKEITTKDFITMGRTIKSGKKPGKPRITMEGAWATWEKMIRSHLRIMTAVQDLSLIRAVLKGRSLEDKEEFFDEINRLLDELRFVRDEIRKVINS